MATLGLHESHRTFIKTVYRKDGTWKIHRLFLCMRSLFGGRIETRWWIAFTLFQFLFGQLMFRYILRDGIPQTDVQRGQSYPGDRRYSHREVSGQYRITGSFRSSGQSQCTFRQRRQFRRYQSQSAEGYRSHGVANRYAADSTSHLHPHGFDAPALVKQKWDRVLVTTRWDLRKTAFFRHMFPEKGLTFVTVHSAIE